MPEETFETPQPTNWTRIILAAVLGFGLLATSAYAGYWYGTQSTVSDKQYEDKISTPGRTQPKNECTKIVSVTKEYPSRYFVACSNTVFIIDEGKITERWSIDQLGSAEITSMIKVGNTLYVGNEGITSINLNTKEFKRYGRDKEMRHVGNTRLAVDGDILWVVTFGDLYKLTIPTGNLQRITEEAPPSRSFDGVIVTEKSVVTLTADAILRYDKTAGSWEVFDKSIFGEQPSGLGQGKNIYSRLLPIDNTMVFLQSYIGQNQPHRYQLWYAPDTLNAEWQVLTEFTNRIEDDYPEVYGYRPSVEIVGYEEDAGSVILRVEQYDDITHYYATPATKEVGLARKKYYDDYIQIDPEERYRDFINNVLESRINNP